MDLFQNNAQQKKNNQPLATRMRPESLAEFVGQEDIVGPGKLLRRSIEADRLHSLIFYGPPGTGKTTLAWIIANETEAEFESLNAVSGRLKDLRKILKRAQDRLGMYSKKTVLFIDEIHRFNKAQQDALLPAVEEGVVILVGATTENPYFEVNDPLVSRSKIFQLQPLAQSDIKKLLEAALKNNDKGLGEYNVDIKEEALNHLSNVANGDARQALNSLELAVLTTPANEAGVIEIDLAIAEESIQQRALNYDGSGDNHYNTISAFIKSLRGSDPDAALYWLARMIKAGEDPKFIARRLIVHAAEDVGNANPHALMMATSAAKAVEFVGMPEARIPLAQATIYIASAPKSNAVIKGIDKAMAVVENERSYQVPSHLRDNHYSGAKDLGHGKGYKYPHNYPNNYVAQDYLPSELKGKSFYQPYENGYEKQIKQFLAELK